MQTSNARAYLIQCAALGLEADFTGRDDVVEAGWIVSLLTGAKLGKDVHEEVQACCPDYPWEGPRRRESDGSSAAGASCVQLSPRGVRIRGARILGLLDLSDHGAASHPLPSLSCIRCSFEAPHELELGEVRVLANIHLSGAHISSLTLTDSSLTHLRGVGLRVDGAVELSGIHPLEEPGTTLGMRPAIFCWCNLSRAIVDGHVIADHMRLKSPPRCRAEPGYQDLDFFELNFAMNLFMCRVSGSIMMRHGPIIDGGILLDSANIQGDVRVEDTTVRNGPLDAAIALETAKVGGSLVLTRTRCTGPVWLMLADISGSCDFEDSFLDGGDKGFAVYAEGATIRGWLRFGATNDARATGSVLPVSAKGCVWLRCVHVHGELSMRSFRVESTVALSRRIHEGDKLLAVCARGIRVGGWMRLGNNYFVGGFDLGDARCATLDDDMSGYEHADPVEIDGFTYQRLESDDLKARIKRLLHSPHRHLPHPYVQLAKVLSAHGKESQARTVLVLKARHQLEANFARVSREEAITLPSEPVGGFAWVRRLFGNPAQHVFGTCFGFGLSPQRALWTFVISLGIGWVVFAWMDARNALVVAQQPVASFVSEKQKMVAQSSTQGASGVRCDDDIQTWLYALDVLVPVVDLREEGKCEIGIPASGPSPGKLEIGAYRVFKALYAFWGWILTSLALLTFSGVLQHRRSPD